MEPIDFKNELITLYNAMRWKENRSVREAQTCRDLRVFITTKFQDNDTRIQLNACDRGDYDPTNEKKTLRATLMSPTNQAPYLQTNPTTNPNTSDQSGNAVEVSLSGITSDQLKELEVLSAKETAAFVEEVKKRGRKPKV
jgi:hypothetical protein